MYLSQVPDEARAAPPKLDAATTFQELWGKVVTASLCLSTLTVTWKVFLLGCRYSMAVYTISKARSHV